MHDQKTLRAALSKAPLFSYSAIVVTRFISERHRGTAGSPLGAQSLGGRYNPPGLPALYTSLKRRTALAEFTRMFSDADAIGVASMMNLIVSLDRVIDITDPIIIRALGTTKSALTALRLPRTSPLSQAIGSIAAGIGADGLIVWSAQVPDEKNLVVLKFAPLPYVIVTRGTKG